MADGSLKIELDTPLADKVRAAANACDLPVEEYVRIALLAESTLIEEGLTWSQDDDLTIDEAITDEFDRTGVGVPWEEMRAWIKSWGSENEGPPPEPRKLR